MARLSAFLLLLAVAAPVHAQGLVWSLPPDGTWIRYAGDYQQVLFDSTKNASLSLTDAKASYNCGDTARDWAKVTCWKRELTVRSVGSQTASYKGEDVPCRWLEFELVTGNVPQGQVGIDPGPVGKRVVKALVPESAVVGATTDARGIPVSFLPVVKGMEKVGDGQVTPLVGNVLQLYPTYSLLAYYRDVQPDPTAGPAGLALDVGTTTGVTGEIVTESRSDRSTNTGVFWRGDNVPFGVAKWQVTIIREKKEATAPRSTFRPRARIQVTMEAVETGTDAKSVLGDPPAAAPAVPGF